jgi:predicted aspartyl protease
MGKFYSGLIDTGSDHTAIRPLIAAEIGASPTDMGVVVHGHGSQIQAMKAPLQVIVPSANVTFSCDAVIVDLTGDSRSFDLILGRNFLRHCHLAVDGPACKYRLTWIG